MNNGFIKLHRKILDWEWYDDPNCMRLFLHCLLRANFKDNNWRGIEIKRGSFLTSLDSLSKETKLSVSQIRTSIKKLKSTGELASSSHARHSVITIVGYESYQSLDKLNDNEITLKSHRVDTEIATNKNVKKEKKVKNKDIAEQAPKFNFKAELINLGVDKELVSDWLAVRRKKKASNTKTAFNTLVNQITKSGLGAQEAIRIATSKSWGGFEANWVKSNNSNQPDFSDESTDWVNQDHGLI